MSVVSLLIAGHNARDAGDLAQAERQYRAAAAADATSVEAFGALGEVLAERRCFADAADAFGRAAELEPNRSIWLEGQGAALVDAGRLEAAVEVFTRLLELRPDAAAAHRGMARALDWLGDTGGAVAHAREALFLNPADAEVALVLADLHLKAGEPLAAAEAVLPVVRRVPDSAALRQRLGCAWAELGETEKALDALRQARALDPDDRLGAATLLARLEQADTAGLPAAYVRTLFDQYADRFEADLVRTLGYRGPQILLEAVTATGAPGQELAVLDLGCGTGLAGEVFRPMARVLAGVDLSPRMVEKARERNLYDVLEVGDAVSALAGRVEAWDLIVAADVLVYIGDLAPLFAAVAAGLRPGGRFAATAESHEGPGFILNPNRRFAHGADYLRSLAAEVGLSVLWMADSVVRWEKRQPVDGLALVLGK